VRPAAFGNRSIRQKLAWIVILASSAALLSASVAFLVYDQSSFRRNLVHRFSMDAEILGFNCASALLFEDPEAASRTLAGLQADPEAIAAAVYDAEGKLFASYRRAEAGEAVAAPAAPDSFDHRFLPTELQLIRPIVLDGEKVGSVFIRASLAEMTRRLESYALIALVVCLGSLIVASAISSRLQTRISQPILHLAETARAVSRDRDYSVRARFHGQDEVGLLVETFNDMLDQIQQRDAELNASQERFNRAISGTTDGLWDWNVQTGEVWYADRFKALLGYDGVEFPGTLATLVAHLHPDDRRATEAMLQRHLVPGPPFDAVFRLRTASGEFRWFHGRAQAVHDARDRPLRMAGSIQDVTERKRAEQALARSERYFRELADAMPQMVWAATPDGKLDYFNRRWHSYTGLAASASVADGWQAAVHVEDRPLVRRRWRQALETGEDYEVEHRLRRQTDGSYRWHLGRAGAVRDENGQISRWFGTCTDIDDQKSTAQLLARQAEDLTRSNAELEQFAYVASHDLQEPLRGVTGCVQLLRQRLEGRLDVQGTELIQHAVDAAHRMQTLITDLLSFSRVGTRGAPFEPTDCGEVLREAEANLRQSIEESGAVITHDELPVVSVDRSQMTRLFQNLIGNGIKFRGDETPRIHVGAERRGSSWLFSVRDNGIGIDPKYFDRIFVVFQRLHTRRRYPGTGIGLPICKKIVERHGGSIHLESEPDKGATFYFTIPALEAEPHEHERELGLQAH